MMIIELHLTCLMSHRAIDTNRMPAIVNPIIVFSVHDSTLAQQIQYNYSCPLLKYFLYWRKLPIVQLLFL